MYQQHRENIMSEASTAWKQLEALEAFGSAVDQEHLDLAIARLVDFIELFPKEQQKPVTIRKVGDDKYQVLSDGFGFEFNTVNQVLVQLTPSLMKS